MVLVKTFFANKHKIFFAKVWCFCLFLFVISFFWYAQATQLFLIGCLLTLKYFPFNLTSLLTDLLPGPVTSISPLERLSSSGCTNSWAEISQNNLSASLLLLNSMSHLTYLKQAKEDFLPPFDAFPAQRVIAKILVPFIDTAHVCFVLNDHGWLWDNFIFSLWHISTFIIVYRRYEENISLILPMYRYNIIFVNKNRISISKFWVLEIIWKGPTVNMNGFPGKCIFWSKIF